MPSLTEQMEALTEEILSSAGDRQEAIASIQSEARDFQSRAREWLTACGTTNRAAMEALREELADGEAARLDAFRQLHDRVAGRLREISEGTGELLADSAEKRRATAIELLNMAEELRQEMAEGEGGRLDAFHQLYEQLADRLQAIAEDTGKLLAAAAAGRRATAMELSNTAEELQTELAGDEKDRLEAFRAMYERLTARLQEIAAETGELQSVSAATRRATAKELVAMADKLRRELADGAAARLDAFRGMHDRLTGRLQEVAAETGELLTASAGSRRATATELVRMAEELRQELTEGAAARLNTFRELHDSIAERIAELSDDVSDIRSDAQSVLQSFRDDIRAAGEAWQALRQARAGLASAGDTETSRPAVHPQRSGKKRRPHAGAGRHS